MNPYASSAARSSRYPNAEHGDAKPVAYGGWKTRWCAANAWIRPVWTPVGRLRSSAGLEWRSVAAPPDFPQVTVALADLQTGDVQQLAETLPQTFGRRLAWSPDGRFLACGTTGSELFLWDMAHNRPLARLQGHTDISDRLAWSPDGSRLASVARDGTLQIWDLSSILAEIGEIQR